MFAGVKMSNWWDIWSQPFKYQDFMARRYCGAWSPELIRLHRLSDLLIWLAYLAIPIVLVAFAWKRRTELPFRKVFLLFALFIVSCGTTYLRACLHNYRYRKGGSAFGAGFSRLSQRWSEAT